MGLRERRRRAQARPDRPAVRLHDPKKAIGPFKRELWELPTKDEILAAQSRKVAFLFTELGVNGSRDMIDGYIHPVEQRMPIPDGIREATAETASRGSPQ